MKRLGLALGGGVARCVAQVGVLAALTEAGIPIAAIAGTSGGALVGALYASGRFKMEELESVARELRWQDILRPGWPLVGLFSSRGIGRYLERKIGPLKFDQLRIPLAVVATDLTTGQGVVLREGSVAEAVQASCSLPLVFTPTRRDGHLLVDGGYTSQIPLRAAREMGAEVVIGVDVNTGGTIPIHPTHLIGIAAHLSALAVRRTVEMERSYADEMIEVSADGLSLFDLSKREVYLARGRRAALDRLPRIRELLQV
jgi:NTE family protein